MSDSLKAWKDTYYRGVLFALNKSVPENPIRLELIDLYQIGEMGLEDGGEVFEHRQKCHEISYVISGEGYFVKDGVKHKVKAGDFHIVAKGEIHRIESGEHSRLRYECIGFQFREDLGEEYRSLISFYEKPPHEVMQDTENIHASLDMMLNELYAEREYRERIFDSCVTQLLIHVYRLYQKMEQKHYAPKLAGEAAGEVVREVMRYIDDHILEIRNVGWISEQLGYSAGYLTKLFKSKTGRNMQQYLQEKKIEYSMRTLRSDEHTVKEVAFNLHYESVWAFSRMFRNYVGLTPNEYLRQQKEET